MLNLQSGLIFNWIPTETFLKHGLSLTVCVGTQPFFFLVFFFKQSVVFIRFRKFNITRYYISLQLSLFFFFWALWLKKISNWALTSPVSSVPAHKSGSFQKKKSWLSLANKEPRACTQPWGMHIYHNTLKYKVHCEPCFNKPTSDWAHWCVWWCNG